jgi:hypothetical protein
MDDASPVSLQATCAGTGTGCPSWRARSWRAGASPSRATETCCCGSSRSGPGRIAARFSRGRGLRVSALSCAESFYVRNGDTARDVVHKKGVGPTSGPLCIRLGAYPSSAPTWRPPARGGQALKSHPRGSEGACMQDPASELPRIPIPRTPVNRPSPSAPGSAQ